MAKDINCVDAYFCVDTFPGFPFHYVCPLVILHVRWFADAMILLFLKGTLQFYTYVQFSP